MKPIFLSVALAGAVGLSVSICSVETLGEGQTMEGMEGFRSADVQVRLAAAQQVLTDRSRVIGELMAIAEDPVENKSRWKNRHSAGNIAMCLLGDIRATEAVPLLVRYIFPGPGEEYTLDEIAPFPAYLALTKIGKPAESALIENIRVNPNGEHRTISAMLIRDIEGPKLALVLLKEAIDSETNVQSRQRLQEALLKVERVP